MKNKITLKTIVRITKCPKVCESTWFKELNIGDELLIQSGAGSPITHFKKLTDEYGDSLTNARFRKCIRDFETETVI